jgi:hypothetical protein
MFDLHLALLYQIMAVLAIKNENLLIYIFLI